MTTKELLNLSDLDVNKMTEKELRAAVSQMASTANKRLKRLQASPVSELSRKLPKVLQKNYNTKQGGKFGVNKKNINQLRNEFVSVRDFLQSKTGSLKELNKERKRVAKELGVSFSNIEEEKRFWREFRKLEEMEASKTVVGYDSNTRRSRMAQLWFKKIALNDVLQDLNDKSLPRGFKAAKEALNAAGIEPPEELTKRSQLVDYMASENLTLDTDGNIRYITDLKEDALEIVSLEVELQYAKERTEFNTSADAFNTVSGSKND